MQIQLPYAEEVNYWKTGRTAPDKKIDQVTKMITDLGGEVTSSLIGMIGGRSAILIEFAMHEDRYRVTWPILQTSKLEKDTAAARIQAATFVYHDIKAKLMTYKVIGAAALADIRLLENNRTPRESLYQGHPDDLKLLT